MQKNQYSGAIKQRDPFAHLKVAGGDLLSERIKRVKAERQALLKAQSEAVEALKSLAATIKSCKTLGFMHLVEDAIDGESVHVPFDGLNVDLNQVAATIAAAFVFNEDFIDGGDLFGM